MHKKYWLLGLVLVIAFGLRFYRVDQVPVSLFWDEIDLGYQARSLLQTGKDYRGDLSPFYVRSFNSDRTPIPAYMTALSTLLFSKPELQVRMAPVVLGTLVAGLGFLLIKKWTKNLTAGLIVGLVLAVSPWQVQFSRIGFEATSVGVVTLGAMLLFFAWLKKKDSRLFYGWIGVLSLGVYTYRTMTLMVPLMFLGIVMVYWPELKKQGFRKLLLGMLLAGVITVPFVYTTTIGSKDQTRIEQISIWSDKKVPIWVQRNREVDSEDIQNPEVGKKARTSSYFFHSKPVSWLRNFTNNYWRSWSSEFLFVAGDSNPRHSTGKGMLYTLDAIGLLMGAWWVVKNWRKKEYRWLVFWLVASPIPTSLTSDGAGHAHRLYVFSLPLLLLIGLGWWRVFEEIKKRRKYLLGLGLMSALALQIIFYYHNYLVHYPLESARSFGSGYKQAMQKIASVEGEYEQVVMVNTIDPPMMYYLFWAQVPPAELQSYGTEFSLKINKGERLDKYKVVSWSQEMTEKNFADNLVEGVLYLVTPSEIQLDLRVAPVPEGVELIELVKHPDNEVAFYLVTKG